MNTQFQNQDVLEIKDADSTLLLAPQFGGRLLSWKVKGRDIIYWPDDANWGNPARVRGGNPLLFPFIARHFQDGLIGFWRDAAGIKREMPTHGFARNLPFAHIMDPDGLGIRMILQDSPQTWVNYPFPFLFEAWYRLIEGALEVGLSTTNKSDKRMPYYSGHHFYFAVDHTLRDSTRLHLPASRRRYQKPDGSLSNTDPGKSSYLLSDPVLHDCLNVLEKPGTVLLEIPGTGIALAMDLQRPDSLPWHTVTTWAEHADSDYYCVEPWLGLPNAIHHGTGLRWLEPGQKETAICRLKVTSI